MRPYSEKDRAYAHLRDAESADLLFELSEREPDAVQEDDFMVFVEEEADATDIPFDPDSTVDDPWRDLGVAG